MISQKLVDAVVTEAAKLRANATAQELNKITFSSLKPESFWQCIYGQATGDCRSPRAVALLRQCAPIAISDDEISNASCKLPRSNKSKMLKRKEGRWGIEAFSPIEIYIDEKGADNRQLIRYLKGKIDTLDLSKTVNC